MKQFLKVTFVEKDGRELDTPLLRIISTGQVVDEIYPSTEGAGGSAAMMRIEEDNGGNVAYHVYKCSETFNQLASVIDGGSETPFELGDLLAAFDTQAKAASTIPYIAGDGDPNLAPFPGWIVNLFGKVAAANKLPYMDGAASTALADFPAKGRSIAAAATNSAARNAQGFFVVTGKFAGATCVVNTADVQTNAVIIPVRLSVDDSTGIAAGFEITTIVNNNGFTVTAYNALGGAETGEKSDMIFLIVNP